MSHMKRRWEEPYRKELSLDRVEFLKVLEEERAVIERLRKEDPDQSRKRLESKDEEKPKGDLIGYLVAQWRLFRSHRQRRESPAGNQASNGAPSNGRRVSKILQDIPETPYSALCLSWGGIRSATFNLGVLQALARYDCLKVFDYLSTVSGGGFIGGWYSAWLHRTKVSENNSPLSALGHNDQTPKRQGASDPFITREAEPVRHLRQYSNYLSPKVGLLSPDTWTLLAIYVRNLLLTSLVFVPFLMAILAVPRLTYGLLLSSPQVFSQVLTPLLGIVAGVVGIAYVAMDLPAIRTQNGSHLEYIRWCLIPLLLSALCLSASWSWYVREPQILRAFASQWISFDRPLFSLRPFSVFFLFPIALIGPGWIYSSYRRRRAGIKFLPGTWLTATVLLGFAALLVGWIMSLLALNPIWTNNVLYTTFSVPLVLTVMMLGGTFIAGLTSRLTTDMDEEWWARSGAYLGISCFVWMLAHAIVLWLPGEFLKLASDLWTHAFSTEFYKNAARSLTAIVGVLSTIFSLWGGFSSKSPGAAKERASDGAVLLAVGATIALLFLLVLMAAASNVILVTAGPFLHPEIAADWTNHTAVIESSGILLPFSLLLGLAVLSVGIGLLVDTNKYSLHYFWRNRIMRAYLGASRDHPAASDTSVAFTGFDRADNLQMFQLQEQRPIHVLNMALNLTGSNRLEWQERKAESFSVSPYYCGNYRLGYRSSRDYGGPFGISLATAVAISGAAVSPNMGYMMSSPVVRLLMTLFNVRLGWWLGNPGKEGDFTFFQTAPRYVLRPLIEEAFGQTDENSPYVYLSDGGHFENLGLYEMVLRRCRFILVSDASTDPGYEYESLGQAVRKIRIDFQIPIVFTDWGSVEGHGGPEAYWATGRILYNRADGTPPESDGDLLYIKPALVMNEPIDVVNYGRQNPSFPQEPISDQFFSESQFESYRTLGDHIVTQLMGRGQKDIAGLLAQAKGKARNPVIGEKIVDELKQLRKTFAKSGR